MEKLILLIIIFIAINCSKEYRAYNWAPEDPYWEITKHVLFYESDNEPKYFTTWYDNSNYSLLSCVFTNRNNNSLVILESPFSVKEK